MASQLPNLPIVQKTGQPHKNSASWRANSRRGIRAEARTETDIDHIERVKALPCCITGAAPPSQAHHILQDRIPNQKAHDWHLASPTGFEPVLLP